MKIKKDHTRFYAINVVLLFIILLAYGCKAPPPDNANKSLRTKHNYIILLDLSDRLIVQNNQPDRDKQIIKQIYSLFESRVKQNLYIKSRDELKVVIAPQRGSHVNRDVFEDRLYINMENIKNVYRRPKEEERREAFMANLDTLYDEAVFSRNPEDYYGADIWKYFYEDLKVDYVSDTLTENYLFVLTDGYPVVGENRAKLRTVNKDFPGLHVVLLEASPWEKDMEWDRVQSVWKEWFDKIGIENYTLIKRGAITKELEQVKEVVSEDESPA